MPARPGDAANSYCGRFVRWRVCCDRRDLDRRIYQLENERHNNRGVVACTEVLHLVAVCEGNFTHRKPRWFVPVFTSPLPRVPTMYREQ